MNAASVRFQALLPMRRSLRHASVLLGALWLAGCARRPSPPRLVEEREGSLIFKVESKRPYRWRWEYLPAGKEGTVPLQVESEARPDGSDLRIPTFEGLGLCPRDSGGWRLSLRDATDSAWSAPILRRP